MSYCVPHNGRQRITSQITFLKKNGNMTILYDGNKITSFGFKQVRILAATL